MFDKKELELMARALLPAFIAALGFWFLGAFEVQQSFFNFLVLISAYLLGLGVLVFAEKKLRLKAKAKFYAVYALVAIASGPTAMAVFGQNPNTFFSSFSLLVCLMFLLPIVFRAVEAKIESGE